MAQLKSGNQKFPGIITRAEYKAAGKRHARNRPPFVKVAKELGAVLILKKIDFWLYKFEYNKTAAEFGKYIKATRHNMDCKVKNNYIGITRDRHGNDI